ISVDHDTITAAGSLAGYQFEGYRGRAKKPFTMALDYEARVRVLHDGGSLATDGHGIAFK
ncbi:MAG: hypothetical protein GTO62_16360, partial [Planctomycetales bacterium]|nr:hypothetical protein [Planctomycetales bacterium]